MQNGKAIARGKHALGAAASSGCCCGLVPCSCVSNPGCTTFGHQLYHYKILVPNGAPQYLFGPQNVECCCKSDGTFTRTYSYELELRLNPAYGFPTDCVVYREVRTGSGNGPGFPVSRKIWSVPFPYTSCAGFALRTDDVIPWFPDCFPVTGSTIGAPLGEAGIVGSYRQTCSLIEWQEQFVSSSTPLIYKYIGFRTIRSEYAANFVGCQTPGCKPCCLSDGTCIQTDPGACTAIGGIVQESCDTCLSIRTGACCDDTGNCSETTRAECARVRGRTFRGEGTTCATITCPIPPPSACCLPNGVCVPTTQVDCFSQGGTWYPGLNCTQVNCVVPQTGACCLADGSCAQITVGACFTAGGTWQGLNSNCGTVACETGACCVPTSHGIDCTIQTPAQCSAVGGVYHGGGSTCTPDPCQGARVGASGSGRFL